eukprot:TRINITY_DN7447_c0_g1_i1.p1 TRINITY_DN7447_c0_g1~~TRINITY_DN7447_c0_g1_i1.p1  ORF type:complete len:301 (-),score=51.43 TRINITY_DN7447_c0_g1_i1:39-872(-)
MPPANPSPAQSPASYTNGWQVPPSHYAPPVPSQPAPQHNPTATPPPYPPPAPAHPWHQPAMAYVPPNVPSGPPKPEVDLLQFDPPPRVADPLDDFFAPSPPPPAHTATAAQAPVPRPAADRELQDLQSELQRLEALAGLGLGPPPTGTPGGSPIPRPGAAAPDPRQCGGPRSSISSSSSSSSSSSAAPWITASKDPAAVVASTQAAVDEAERRLLQLRLRSMAPGKDSTALHDDWVRLNGELMEHQVQLDLLTGAPSGRSGRSSWTGSTTSSTDWTA